MTVHALFQFNEAAYGLTRLVVDWMTFHDSTLLYWQSEHVDWVFVLDLVLYDSKKGGGNPYDRDRTMLNIKNEPYRKLVLKYEIMYIIHAKGHTLC